MKTREQVSAGLMAPFKRSEVRFKEGAGGKFYPYFDNNTLLDRLIEATENNYSLTIDFMQWRDRDLVITGHMEIPGLGRRAGIGMQEHTSAGGNQMGADMIKGARADLIKNCLVAFGCGNQARTMDPITFDPYDPRNKERIRPYLDNFFPRQDHVDPVREREIAASYTEEARPLRAAGVAPIGIGAGGGSQYAGA